MKIIKTQRLKPVLFLFSFIITLGMISLPRMNSFPDPGIMTGIQSVWASERYGILGHMAPELALDTWINGSGKEIEPIFLKDYRGKVVYLYFFQNW